MQLLRAKRYILLVSGGLFSSVFTPKSFRASRHVLFLLLLLTCALVLPACGGDRQSPEEEDGVLIYAALNPVTTELTRSIKKFNEAHPDTPIEVRDYSDEGGRERLQIELALGQVPDIMEMRYYGKSGEDIPDPYKPDFLPGIDSGPEEGYFMPYRQMAERGYLEDLWPYIENDPELGREAVLEAPLKASEVNGGLYMLFQRYTILTLIGRESVVGDRYSWTMDDVMETYASMPEGSTVMRYNLTKRDVFYNLLCNSLDRFVDRATGECTFDSEEFRNLVGFLEMCPDEMDYERVQEAEREIRWRIMEGTQMLEGISIVWPQDIGFSDSILQERAAFVGYPTADGSSGSFFYLTGRVLGMSSTCRGKDAAWDYIRTLITPRLKKNKGSIFSARPVNMQVNRNDFEAICWYELYETDDLIRRFPDTALLHAPRTWHFQDGSEVYLMELISEEHIQRFEDLVDHTTQFYWPDNDLSNIVWETLGAYFAGDRTLDDTIRLIDNRVGLYLKEQQ